MARPTKTRLSVCVPSDLAEGLDRLVADAGYPSRSQAVSELIRSELTRTAAGDPSADIVGTVTLLYDHHRRNLTERLTGIQHDYHELIRSVLHVHISHTLCMEVLAVSGRAGLVRELADRLTTAKGVLHGQLAVTGLAAAERCGHDEPHA